MGKRYVGGRSAHFVTVKLQNLWEHDIFELDVADLCFWKCKTKKLLPACVQTLLIVVAFKPLSKPGI